MVYGDIIYYNNEEHVFLALDGNEIYALKILDYETSSELKNAYSNHIRRNNINKQRLQLYSFIELETIPFKGRVVTFVATSGYDIKRIGKSSSKLTDNDCNNIKNEIKESKAVPIILKKLLA